LWAFEIGKDWTITLLKCQLNFSQSPIWIHITLNDRCYSYFVCWCPSGSS
jgi:hypothetical protein